MSEAKATIQVTIRYGLYDPVKQRYYSDGAIGREFAKDAHQFGTIALAEKMRDSWWKNKRFSQVIQIITVAKPLP